MKALGVGLAAVLALQAFPAGAASHTWVSGTGDDMNPCSITAPCKTFNGAQAKTDPHGIVTVLDPGSYGGTTILKSISIVADGVVATTLVQGATAAIHINAGPNDVVHLRGLLIEGTTTGGTGILVSSALETHIENCLIRGFQAGKAVGIAFEPTVASTLFVSDTTVVNNGTANGGGGIHLAPTANGSGIAVIDRSRVKANRGYGIKADATSGGGSLQLNVRDSVVAGNAADAGISIVTPVGGHPVYGMIDRSAVNNNHTGVRVDGAGTRIFLSNTTITRNETGLAFANSGSLTSFGNNSLVGNVNDGAPTGTIPMK